MKNVLGFPQNVFVLGLVSLFMDISSEMIYPLIPIFLSDVLHTSKTSIGIIEGIAESTASILKVFSGWLSDRLGKRKSIILWGYGISVLSRPLLANASSWIHVLVYRFTDRFGKGVRTAPRDAIIADSTDPKVLGKAFGFHRSMDTVGAILGPTIAFAILGLFNNNLRWVFWLSIIPGFLAVLTIFLFVKEKKRPEGTDPVKISLKGLDNRFKFFLFIASVFTLGRTSDVFLILRVQDLGVKTAAIPLLYLAFNMVSAMLSTPAGIWADKAGKRRVIVLSYLLFSLIFTGFAVAAAPIHAWLLFMAYGVFVAINEGVQRAYVATLINPEVKATGYGIYHTVIGLSALPSSIIAGALWQHIGPQALFYYGAAMAMFSSILFFFFIYKGK
ncbi:MAG: MFS transporter [Nitrospirae bacterium]|nr:MFS transporter [Nitrospirota bacterium]